MKIITEVKVIETPKSIHEIAYWVADAKIKNIPNIGFDGQILNTEIAVEIIKGRRFINPRLELDVVIACNKEAGELLGLQYEAFENLDMENITLTKEITKLNKKIQSLKNVSIWKRIKFLFKGVSLD